MQFPPIATTTVGSFPRPSWLADRERSEVKFRIEGPPLREAEDDATLLILGEQEEIGLDLLTDGEQRLPHFINHVLVAVAASTSLTGKSRESTTAGRSSTWFHELWDK